jgi:hypothetical protein
MPHFSCVSDLRCSTERINNNKKNLITQNIQNTAKVWNKKIESCHTPRPSVPCWEKWKRYLPKPCEPYKPYVHRNCNSSLPAFTGLQNERSTEKLASPSPIAWDTPKRTLNKDDWFQPACVHVEQSSYSISVITELQITSCWFWNLWLKPNKYLRLSKMS